MKKNILQALHASGIGAHSGITATYHRIKALFAWTGIFQSVESFVNKCQKGRRMHMRNYSSKKPSEPELELFRDVEQGMVDAEAGVGDAARAGGFTSGVAARGASGL